MNIIIYPYQLYSRAAKNLQVSLQRYVKKVLRAHEESKFTHLSKSIIINYGNPRWPIWIQKYVKLFGDKNIHMLNRPESVTSAIDKLLCFRHLKEAKVPIPEFTTDYKEALSWGSRKPIVQRWLTKASGGRGMAVIQIGSPVTEQHEGHRVLLWTKYISKKYEYRVHVFNGKVIDSAIKRRRKEFDGQRDPQIRNLDNGYVYCREEFKLPPEAELIAIQAVKALKLDFGAVDMIHNVKHKGLYVLEVNTAAGLEGHTCEAYTQAIMEYINAKK